MTVERAPLGRPFWTLFSSATVSGLGDGLRYTALPLLAASLTRDPLQVALVGVASYLPVALFGLLSGAVADRVERRRLQTITEQFVGIALGGLLFAVSAALPFGIDAVSFAVSALLLIGMPGHYRGRDEPTATRL